MNRFLTVVFACLFAVSVASPVLAQEKKQEQIHKGTPEQGSVQKQDKKKDQKKDGSGAKAKAADK